MNLEETVKTNRLRNGDTIHVRGRLKGGSNKPKMDIEEEKENWPNFTPTQPPLSLFSRRTTTSPTMWANQETADKSTQTMTNEEVTRMESQLKHDQVSRL